MVRLITFAAFPEFELLDLSGPLAVFTVAAALHGAPYAVRVVSASGGGVGSTGGLSVVTTELSDDVGSDTLVGLKEWVEPAR